MHFVIRYKSALQAGGLGVARLQKERIAVFEQFVGAHLVENGAAVDFALHGKSHAGGNIGFNQAGNHVHARALGGYNHVDAGGARFLRQTGDLLLHRFALGHHQVGQFINHQHNHRQRFERLGRIGVEAEGVEQGLAGGFGLLHFLVEALDIAHAHMREQAVAFFHFGHAPIERLAGFAHIGNHGAEQVRNAVVNAQFEHFRVDHDKAHFFGRGLEKHRHNHAVYAHRFARAGHAGHQKVRHFGQIAHHRHAGDVFAQRHGELGFGFGKHISR